MENLKDIKGFFGYCIIILLIFAFLLLGVVLIIHQPNVVKDYGNFAIVEMDGDVYIWNKETYGEGAMLRMKSQEAESGE